MSKLILASLMLCVSVPCFAQVGAPDASCDPTIDPPVTGGCTWYNYYLVPNGTTAGTTTAGSSFHNYYSNAGNPPWTVTTTAPTVLRVVDGGHQGDVFAVFDNGVELGTSTPVAINPNHSCANDPTGTGTDPAACWNDPLMSHGIFQLPAGSHSITISWAQPVPGGMSSLQWFEIGDVTTTSGGLPFVGSTPQIASQFGWATTFTLVNTGSSASNVNFSAFGQNGLPLTLPLDLVQSSSNSLAATLNETLSPNASLIVQSTGPVTSPLLEGGGQVGASGDVSGFAVFHINASSQEAVVPLEQRNAGSYTLAFDNTNNVATGVAIENISAQAVSVNTVIRDGTGAIIGSGPISLPASGQTAFVLSTQFAVTAGILGTMEFDTPPNGQISVMGIRYTPPGVITTIPVLANVGTSGGSLAQIASGGGWQTSFLLVNTGLSLATAQLSFFGDSGAPLALPLTAPQTNTTVPSTSVVNTALNPNQLLVINTNDLSPSSAVQIGSAQLTTSGNISGYIVFTYLPNGQQAVVPFESRNAPAYIIAFDNTANTATGIAVNNAANAAANIPVVLRDSNGNQVGTGSIPLAANGHSAFVLSQQFPATNNIQGTIEFDTPAGGSIGAVGIRTPPALTFTTLPSLVR